MIPILYDTDEILFTSNGLGRLRDCISCIVTEERNGIYECDFEYPVTGRHFDMLQCGRIIGVTHEDSDDIQPFDIVSYSRPIDGIVTFHAVHISYRQSCMTVKTTAGVNSLADAFTMLRTAEPSNPFSYYTDKTSSAYLACADGTPRSVRQMLGGIEGSILDTYGGEYEWDKWSVNLYQSRGTARDFSIRYGVNMSEFNDETDSSEVYSSCIPYWTNGEEFVIGDRQDSGAQTPTGRGECIPLDVSEKFEDKPTKAQVEAQGALMLTNTNLPKQTITVEFVRLQDLGYEEFSNLYQCRLCDTVNVIFPGYNMSGRFKIVRTEWNVLKDRYESMELGSLSPTLAEALGISNTLSSSSSDITAQNITASGTLTINGKATLGALDAGIFTISSHSSGSDSTNTGNNRASTISLSKSGYTPIGVVGWNIESSSSSAVNAGYANLMRCYLSARGNGTGTVTYVYRNLGSGTLTATLYVDVLWLKTTA